MEYGVKIPISIGKFRKQVSAHIEDADNNLTPASRFVLNDLLQELYRLDETIEQVTHALVSLAKQVGACQLLVTIPGVSWIVASGIYARLGDGSAYKCGRDAGASIGLVPAHSGTGGKNKTYGITKRGDRYLRSLVVHGARAVVGWVRDKEDKLSCWIREQASRNHLNKTVVALVNKIIRIAHAVLRSGAPYQSNFA